MNIIHTHPALKDISLIIDGGKLISVLDGNRSFESPKTLEEFFEKVKILYRFIEFPGHVRIQGRGLYWKPNLVRNAIHSQKLEFGIRLVGTTAERWADEEEKVYVIYQELEPTTHTYEDLFEILGKYPDSSWLVMKIPQPLPPGPEAKFLINGTPLSFEEIGELFTEGRDPLGYKTVLFYFDCN